MHYVGNSKKLLRDKRKADARARRVDAPAPAGTAKLPAPVRPALSTWLPRWWLTSQAKRLVRLASRAQLVAALGEGLPAVILGMARDLRIAEEDLARAVEVGTVVGSTRTDPVLFRYMLVRATAARAAQDAQERTRIGRRRWAEGRGLDVQVRLDDAQVLVHLEFFEACHHVLGLYEECRAWSERTGRRHDFLERVLVPLVPSLEHVALAASSRIEVLVRRLSLQADHVAAVALRQNDTSDAEPRAC